MKRIVLALLVGLVCASAAVPATAQAKKKVVFLAGTPSHGFGAHEHNPGCRMLAKAINESGLPLEAVVFENVTQKNFPSDADLAGAAAVVIYCDGGNGHLALAHLKELDDLSNKGVGIGCIHYAVEPGDGKKQPDGRAEFLRWLGGYYETFLSVNPHWRGTFTEFPKHPVTSGIKPFRTDDEWYYHMRFRENMEGVTPILTSVPPDGTRKGKDDAHGGNAEVRAGLGQNLKEHVMWVSENKNGSRGFGCTGGHNHMNWWQDQFRTTVLNAIVWIAKADVPADGVKSTRPAAEEYLNQDEKPRTDFDMEKVKKAIEEMNKPLDPAAAAAPAK